MINKLKQTLPIAFLLLCGCMTPTPYQKDKVGAFAVPPLGGYVDNQLSALEYEVEFLPNGFTKQERTEDFTLLRAAELTIEKQLTHFVIISWQRGLTTKHIPPKFNEPAHDIVYAVSKMKIQLIPSGAPIPDSALDARNKVKEIRAKYNM